MRRRAIAQRIALILVVVGLLAPAATASAAAAPLRIRAEAVCRSDGGLDVTLSVTNLGQQTITARSLHAFLEVVRPGGPEGVGALFFTLAPDFGTIRPGDTNELLLQFDPSEPGIPVGGVGAKRLMLGIELFVAGRDRPIVRHFSFPACRA